MEILNLSSKTKLNHSLKANKQTNESLIRWLNVSMFQISYHNYPTDNNTFADANKESDWRRWFRFECHILTPKNAPLRWWLNTTLFQISYHNYATANDNKESDWRRWFSFEWRWRLYRNQLVHWISLFIHVTNIPTVAKRSLAL